MLMKNIILIALTCCALWSVSTSLQAQTYYKESPITTPTTIAPQQVVTPSSTLNANEPRGYSYKCTFHDNHATYFVMPNGEIRGMDLSGNQAVVGKKQTPPKGREGEFSYMIAIDNPRITYAVDRQGHIWQSKYPFKEIVGAAKTPSASYTPVERY